MSSERQTQISLAILATFATALGTGIFISSPLVATTDAAQYGSATVKMMTTANSLATSHKAADIIGSNITFGNPQFIGTEYVRQLV